MKIDLTTLDKYKEEGWLKNQTHPTLPLTIWNYTPNTQYESKWNDITMLCRGLVTDDEGNIVAHPLKKFFNYSEPQFKLPEGETFEVWDKLDGSFIQVFWYKGERIISSKGSFNSDQSIWATKIWDKKYGFLDEQLDKSKNYIFELVC